MIIYRCNKCKNIVMVLNKGMCIPNCCGEEMQELTPNTTDASTEKHIPVVEINDDNVVVQIGSILHPMTEEHFIEFVILETNLGSQIHYLKPGDEAKTSFKLNNYEKVVAVYDYCNLHGLWKKDI